LGSASPDSSASLSRLATSALSFLSADGGELIFERGALLHHALGALLVVPEVRVLGLPVELGQASARPIDVKDASSAVRSTA
jgi:hypothetical protein